MLLDEKTIQSIIKTLPETNDVELVSMTYDQPVMLIFLRHFGCTFCRQALSDLSKIKKDIDELGVKIVYVHMVDKTTANEHLTKYNFSGNTHLGDPDKKLYHHFGLQKGNFRQLYGLNVMMRGFKAGLIDGHGHGFKAVGDMEQMPGLFMLANGEVIRSYVYQLSSDRPDYLEFIEFALINNNLKEV